MEALAQPPSRGGKSGVALPGLEPGRGVSRSGFGGGLVYQFRQSALKRASLYRSASAEWTTKMPPL